MNDDTLHMLHSTLSKAVTEVCSMMLGESVEVGEPSAERLHRDGTGVRGSIDITGDVTGEATIQLPTATAVNLVSAFVGVPIEPDDEAFEDAIGELANMVVGSAKSHFEGLNCSISCPKVTQVSTLGGGHAPDFSLPVTGQSGDFAIEVLLAA